MLHSSTIHFTCFYDAASGGQTDKSISLKMPLFCEEWSKTSFAGNQQPILETNDRTPLLTENFNFSVQSKLMPTSNKLLNECTLLSFSFSYLWNGSENELCFLLKTREVLELHSQQRPLALSRKSVEIVEALTLSEN